MTGICSPYMVAGPMSGTSTPEGRGRKILNSLTSLNRFLLLHDSSMIVAEAEEFAEEYCQMLPFCYFAQATKSPKPCNGFAYEVGYEVSHESDENHEIY